MQDSNPPSGGLLRKLGAPLAVFPLVARWLFGQRIAAVMGLTWKAAFRFRLFLVITVLLLASVVGLPLLIKDDGTARGFTQILLTYTLSTITTLLGLSTLWLACGILARDIEDCQMQVVAVKPIARWQIWLGKWLGLVSLNAALLAISGGCIFVLLEWRSTTLPPAEQKVLREEVLVARGSVREKDQTADIEQATDQLLRERLQQNPSAQVNVTALRKDLNEQVKADYQVVPPGYTRQWQVDLGFARYFLRNKPLHLRIKFNAAEKSQSGTFTGLWQVGLPNQAAPPQRLAPMSLAPDTFHEFEIPANMFDDSGRLTVLFVNSNDTALLFPLEDGFEVLYPEGGFANNYLRGLGIILCWMAVLAALGLASASFLSFPVAAFLSLGILTLVLGSGTIAGAISDGSLLGFNAETNVQGHSPLDLLVLPIFRALLKLVELAKDFSPIDSLSSGRTIAWSTLGRAFVQIVLLLGGFFMTFGIVVFTRRELATAQGNQ